ncbi:fumarylacetoacetate hydrolase family protein [Heyndrickxia acidicola]|uniref:Fumarylacetoacetate hydrolase family protein n=1 Tax=Heyndrickxia acidicola TaxID=209389 RepID=A0ABU6MDV6_9BACI|nr:fumarylacetoacetate hydrolase family protein [Heyndrickxia acidicola]MED1202484.1 fumarylacetoacetate hydrolase family protein [Heyndrickxia acidicola]
MRFLTFHANGKEQFGILFDQDSTILNLSLYGQRHQDFSFPATLLEAIKQGDAFLNAISGILETDRDELMPYLIGLKDISLLAPIPTPVKNIFCIGKNYRDHAIEMGSATDIPTEMIVFTKAPTTVIGHLSEIDSHPEVTSQLDYEGELAVVIGKKGKSIPQDEAMEHIFGYTIINDITARDLQEKHKQYFIGKSLDTSCPMGPWIVSRSEIENPEQLSITTKVNGNLRQDSNTEHFIFPIREMISVLSKGMTLEPGDIIATGTPAGVGKGFKPPKFLAKGDKIEVTVEMIGTLTNVVK